MLKKCVGFLTIGKFPLSNLQKVENNVDRRNSCRSLETNCYANVVTSIIYQFDSPNFSTNEYERHRNSIERQEKYISINRNPAPMFHCQ